MNNVVIPAVCEHLQPFLSRLLTRSGTSVLAVDDGWSAMDFVIVLNKGPSLKELKTFFDANTSPVVEAWENFDQHYPLQVGLVCKACKQGISWPTP